MQMIDVGLDSLGEAISVPTLVLAAAHAAYCSASHLVGGNMCLPALSVWVLLLFVSVKKKDLRRKDVA
jgi:hypothetical protein